MGGCNEDNALDSIEICELKEDTSNTNEIVKWDVAEYRLSVSLYSFTIFHFDTHL